MKKLILVLSMVMVPAAHAGLPAGMTEVKEPRNPYIELAYELSRSIVSREVFGNCGNVQVVRLDTLEGVNVTEAITAIVTNEYVESVSVAPAKGKDFDKQVAYAVSSFTGDPSYCDDHVLTEQVEVQNALESLIKAAAGTDNKNGLQLYQGSLEGAFSLGISFMAVVDAKNREILVAGEGYCE